MDLFEMYKEYIDEQYDIGFLLSDYSMIMELSDNEYETLMTHVVEEDLSLAETIDYLNVTQILQDGINLIIEDSSWETLKNKKEQRDRMKNLGNQFLSKKTDSREKRLQATALRTVNYKWNKKLKQWIKRDKPLDFNETRRGLVKKSIKFKSFKGAKIAIKATQRRHREKFKSKRVGALLKQMSKSHSHKNTGSTNTTTQIKSAKDVVN